jgi:protein SCO1/2
MMKIPSAILLLLLIPWSSAMGEIPGDSIYNIESDWVDQNGQSSNITSWQGKTQVLAFVYTYCEHSCPIIVSNLKQIEQHIPAELKADVRFSLVSLDPGRDTPSVLNAYMQKEKLASGQWMMFNGDPDDVLELSALVGVRYKPMDTEGKDIAHSNMITVLDSQGRIHYQMKGFDESLQRVVEEIEKAANLSH